VEGGAAEEGESVDVAEVDFAGLWKVSISGGQGQAG